MATRITRSHLLSFCGKPGSGPSATWPTSKVYGQGVGRAMRGWALPGSRWKHATV